jgi:hypothetical protein
MLPVTSRLSEQVHANNPREAQQVVQARNPNARIVNVTVPRSSADATSKYS